MAKISEINVNGGTVPTLDVYENHSGWSSWCYSRVTCLWSQPGWPCVFSREPYEQMAAVAVCLKDFYLVLVNKGMGSKSCRKKKLGRLKRFLILACVFEVLFDRR